jgi:hypothetical protein
MARASSSRRVERRVLEDRVQQAGQHAPDHGSWRDSELGNQVVAVDGEVLCLERIADDGRHPLAQLVPAVRGIDDSGGHVIRRSQREELGQQVDPDASHEAAHGGIGPVGGIGEHVVADQARDPRDLGARRPQAQQDLLGHERPIAVVVQEVAVRKGGRLPDVVEEACESQHGVRRRQGVGGAQRVIQGIAREGLRLGHAAQRRQLGEQHGQQPQPLHQPEGA